MYRISRNEDYLMVKFIDDFDYPVIRAAMHHETMLREYADTNDIWIIGRYRADICLGEIDLMVREFACRCPRDARRTKTAIVVDEGITGSIVALWANGLRKRVAFEIKIFPTLDKAQCWLNVNEAQVA